ncbi:MAG: flagellar protein FliT [Gammaproteobacteria bacterium]|nr:flagellar protein FliT [Gammaproteobacteria bacterium]MDH5801319.1 flagellar protein FliT [Gammaproteobacteria bacterium]
MDTEKQSWQSILELGRKMFDLAERNEWEELLLRQKDSDELIKAVFSQPSGLPAEELRGYIMEAQDWNQKTAAITEQHRQVVAAKLSSLNNNRKACDTYKKNTF